MEYIKLDPCIDSDPDVEAAGWCAARVFELLLKVAAWKDLRGCIPPQCQSAVWLARRWNLSAADLPGVKPEDFIANGVQRLFEAGLLSQSADGWLIRGWAKFYQGVKSGAERMQELRDRRAPTSPGAPLRPKEDTEKLPVTNVTRDASDERDATSPTHPRTSPTSPTHPQKKTAPVEASDGAQLVFGHWRKRMGKNANAAFDKKRVDAVEARLAAGYVVEDLCLAIDGCAVTPHNIGQNDRGERFDDLELICRNAGQVDRFIANARNPPVRPVAKGRAGEADKVWDANTRPAEEVFNETG